jgi:penicillin V acylase-like amidase (Ntn superfamily)
VKTQRYVNQSESGEARVADSNSGGGGNAPFFIKHLSEKRDYSDLERKRFRSKPVSGYWMKEYPVTHTTEGSSTP